jgi:hypothetical protein
MNGNCNILKEEQGVENESKAVSTSSSTWNCLCLCCAGSIRERVDREIFFLNDIVIVINLDSDSNAGKTDYIPNFDNLRAGRLAYEGTLCFQGLSG